MSAEDRTKPTLFLGLEPDAEFGDLVWAYKRRAEALVGPQLFLDHAPHLTIYLAAFDDADATTRAAEQFAATVPPVAANVIGWHTFWADRLTGRHTLVCQFEAATIRMLRSVQTQAIRAIAPQRNVAATKRRYADRLEQLLPVERASIEQTGFPYTGEHWRPHVTIASIAVNDWPAVEREIVPEAPQRAASFARLTCCRLVDEQPVAVRSFPLGHAAACSGALSKAS